MRATQILTEQARKAASMAQSMNPGVAALQELLRNVGAVSAATCGVDEQVDQRDYRAIAKMVEASISSNVTHADAVHRNGYLLALARLLCLNADGACASPEDLAYPLPSEQASVGGGGFGQLQALAAAALQTLPMGYATDESRRCLNQMTDMLADALETADELTN